MDNKTILKWPAALLLAFLFLLGMQGCSETAGPKSAFLSGTTMGTTYSVKWYGSHTLDSDIQRIHQSIELALNIVNDSMSTYIPDSELSKFNALPESSKIEASEGLFKVLSLSEKISNQTQGAFDITVGPLVNLWGFGPDARVIKAPTDDEIEALRDRVGYQKLKLNSVDRSVEKAAELYVDLSAVAKGYGVDQLAEVMELYGIESYLVEIGGELRSKGLKPNDQSWKIAVENPSGGASRDIQQIVSVSNTGIATSGDYRNYFESDGIRYSHTINPSTGKPITHKLASVTVLMPTCAEADALATAFMVMGEVEAYDFALNNEIDAFFIVKSDDGFIEKMTPGFENRLVK